MTTIATDGVTIAADGQRTWGAEIVQLDAKKLRVHQGRGVYALTGSAAMFDAVVNWFEAGLDLEKVPKIDNDDAWALLVIDKYGIGKLSQTSPYLERFPPPMAIGAGGELAQGMLLAGVSPQRAVELVAARCNHTGGEIQVINIAEALEPALLEAAE